MLRCTFFLAGLALFGMSFSAAADEMRVQVPSAFPPHPRLFTNANEIRDLKLFIRNTPAAQKYVDSFLSDCETRVNNRPVPPETIKHLENRKVSLFARDMALAYLLSGKTIFARAAADALRSYVPLYPHYPVTQTKGRAMPSTLNEARWAIDLATAYDLIYQAGVLSDDEKAAIETDIFIPCGEVLRICNHKTRSNWRARAIAGLGVIGFCIGKQDFIEEAINGHRDSTGWLIRNGFIHQIAYSVLGDGIFYERSFGYQAFTSDSYFLLMEAARHGGIDLWNLRVPSDPRDAGADQERQFGQPGTKSIKALYDALFYRTFSDGAVTNVANATADHFVRRRYYEAAWRAWKDPKYAFAAQIAPADSRPWDKHLQQSDRITDPSDLLWLAPLLPKGHFDLAQDATIGNSGIHQNGCTLFPNGGYAILRQSTDPSAVCAEMNFGLWGSGHSHPDKLSIVISDGTKKIVREVNYFGYADPQYLTWDRQTIAHNTITVDETSQEPQGDNPNPWPIPRPGALVRGRPLLFYPGNTLKAFRAACDDAYPGVQMTRTIALVDSVVFDFFLVQSKVSHQYDYALHIDAPISVSNSSFSNRSTQRLSNKSGYRHIDLLKQGRSPFTAQLHDIGTIQCFSPGSAFIGRGIKGKQTAARSVILLRQEGATALYLTAFRLKPHCPPISLIQSDQNEQVVAIGKHFRLTNSHRGLILHDSAGEIVEQTWQPDAPKPPVK